VIVMGITLSIVHPLPCDAWGTVRGAPDFSRMKQSLCLLRQASTDAMTVKFISHQFNIKHIIKYVHRRVRLPKDQLKQCADQKMKRRATWFQWSGLISDCRSVSSLIEN
jgi:hypothetical protein